MCQSRIGGNINLRSLSVEIIQLISNIIYANYSPHLLARCVSEEKDEFKNSVTQQLVARFNETLAICRVVPGHRKKEGVCGWRENYRRDEVAINNAKWSRDASLLSPLF